MSRPFSKQRAATISQLTWLHDPTLHQWIWSHLDRLGRSVLDVGAGNGSFSLASGRFVAEVDPTEYPATDRPGLIRAEGATLPLRDQSVDVAFCKSALHHFDVPGELLTEMTRVARNAVCAVEVIAPDDCVIPFLQDLLSRKEVGRRPESVYTEQTLETTVRRHTYATWVRTLHLDQYINVDVWLSNSDLAPGEAIQLRSYVEKQTPHIRRLMQMHFMNGELFMLRRMALCIASEVSQ